MGKNLNLDDLSEDEREHILTVVKQDFMLRDVEKHRLRCGGYSYNSYLSYINILLPCEYLMWPLI
jgi:hypothetical protein